MAEHNNLTSLFSDIADAIREKNGSTGTIVADNFPEEIDLIDTQEDLDPELADQDAKIAELQELLQGKAVPAPEDLTEELAAQSEIIAEQDELITQLASALEGKAGGNNIEVVHGTFTLSSSDVSYNITIPGVAGKENVVLSFLGDWATSNNKMCYTHATIQNVTNIKLGLSYATGYEIIHDEESGYATYDVATGELKTMGVYELFREGLYEYFAW